MFGMTTWEQVSLMVLVWIGVQIVLLLVWARFARHEEDRRREVMRDDVGGLNVFDDE